MLNNFAIFILTHGRPNAQHTLNTLIRLGYTGKYYLVIDDTDITIQDYIDNYGAENIIVFDKNHYINSVNIGTNKPMYKSILYAKCAGEDIARDLGLDAFVLVDDDLTGLRFRYLENESFKSIQIHSGLDTILNEYVDFMLSGNIAALSFGTAQMYMGGAQLFNKIESKRIPYNFVFRNTKYNFEWRSEMYEDTATPLVLNQRGLYTFQPHFVQLEMKPLAAGADGGMTTMYQNMDVFNRISYIYLYSPSCVRVQNTGKKLTHAIVRDSAFPKLLSSSYKVSS